MADKPLNGYLDRMRRNISSLDASIEDVRKAPKGEKPAEQRQRLKLLRDLVELQNQTLAIVKTHLLGRDETGSPTEPPTHYDSNAHIMFERDFRNFLSPWTVNDLKLKCSECEESSENVKSRRLVLSIDQFGIQNTEYRDLCEKCYHKRSTEPSRESEDAKPYC